MEIRHASWVAAAMFASALLFYFWERTPTEDHTPPTVATSPPVRATAVVPVTPYAAKPEARLDEIAAMREQIAALRAEISSLRGQRTLQTSPAQADAKAGDDLRSNALARAEAARNRQMEMAAVESAFRREAVDTKWSANASAAVQQALNSGEAAGAQLGSVECRSDTCRVEIADNGSGQLAKSLPLVAQQVAETFPTITVNNVEQGNGASAMVLYMSRQSAQPGS
jgi:hypothetical protein